MPDTIDSFTPLAVKSCNIPMEDLGLLLRCNGEQEVSIVDRAGNIFHAGIPIAEEAPTLVSVGSSANKIPNGYYAYAYCYAATTKYPLIAADTAINGSIAPRGNSSDALIVNASNASNQVTINVTGHTRRDLTEIWIFRTDTCASEDEAILAASAGRLFYIGKVNNVYLEATIAYTDIAPTTTLDKLEYDNFPAPQFAYAVYESPYVWGIGNPPFIADVSWSGTVVSLTNSNRSWFEARNGQIVTVTGITTGGFDEKGSFYFLYKDSFSCYLSVDGTTAATLAPSSGSGIIKIQGVASTLYRSKANNPLAWGETIVYGTTQIAQLFSRRVGGGLVTAIATLPGGELLKIDTKNPNACYVYNLRLAGQAEFTSSRRKISDFSIGSHFSQFKATLASGQKVLWGFDPDALAILQCDGTSQYPISQNVQNILKNVDTNPDRLKFAYGVCDEVTHHNAMWLPMYGRPNNLNPNELVDSWIFPYDQTLTWMDLGILQQYQTGKWTTEFAGDQTCAAQVRDNYTDRIAILGGTSTGLIGKLFDIERQYNWAPIGFSLTHAVISPGDFSPSTSTFTSLYLQTDRLALQLADSDYNSETIGDFLIGTWVIMVHEENRILLRISGVSSTNITTFPTPPDYAYTIDFDCWLYDYTTIVNELRVTEITQKLYIHTTTANESLFGAIPFGPDSPTEYRMHFGQAPASIVKQIQIPQRASELKKLEYVQLPKDFAESLLGYITSNPVCPFLSATGTRTLELNNSPAALGTAVNRELWLRFNFYLTTYRTNNSLRYILLKLSQ